MTNSEMKEVILQTLEHKAAVKQKVFDNTKAVFEELKVILKDISEEYNKELQGGSCDERVCLEVKERGDKEISIKVAGDLLIFSMHTNVFQFFREHDIWNNPYVMVCPDNAYSGMITIYNFLSDSFKFNRLEDLGYLVARIFINRENHFLVEGKRQIGFRQQEFDKAVISKESLRTVIETAINYSLNFDLLVPPYDNIKIASVAQMHEQVQNSRIRTGKRLGFRFNSDDVN